MMANMIFKAGIEKLKWSDLDLLTDEPYHEGEQLDFKEKIPDKEDKQGWERIFASICAFANTEGGTLIFGIKEEGGAAKKICPFLIDDFESIRLRFIEKIRLYITPTPTIKFSLILKEDGSNEGCLLIQVLKAFNGPHMLSNHANLSPGKQCRFYKRVESQSFVMEHKEIGEQFMISEKWEEMARQCFQKRKGLLKAREHPVSLDEAPYAIFYLTPLGSRNEKISFNQEFLDALRLPTSQNLGFDRDRTTFEGHLFYNYIPVNKSMVTTKLLNIFYNGSIEIIFGKNTTTIEYNSISHLQEGVMERDIVKLCTKLFGIYNKFFQFLPPFAVFYNLIDVKGKKLRAYQHFDEAIQEKEAEMRGTNIHIYRDELFSDVYIETDLTSEKVIGEVFRPLFDPVWRSIGKEQSLNYNNTGEWIEKAS